MFRRLTPIFLSAVLLALAGCRKPAAAPGQSSQDASPSADGVVELIFTYGSEKEEWIKEVTTAFNRENHRLASGKIVRVTATAMGSGECLDEIITGTRRTA